MCGLLASEGVKVAEGRIGKALHKVNESYHLPRVAITSTDMGYSIHDQLFILVYMELVTKITCVIRNGIEVAVAMAPMSLLVARISTPVKNNIEIYNHLFR